MASLALIIKGETAYSRTFGTGAVSTSGDTITVPNHNLSNGDTVRLTSGTTIPAGITSGRLYYVVGRTVHTFQISTTSGGSAVDITSTGTGTHTVTKEATEFKKLNFANRKEAAIALSNYFAALASGYKAGSVDMHLAPAHPAAASGTITLASVALNDTIVIGGVTLTAKTSPSGEAQFTRGGADDTADAASLAAIINAHSTLSRMVSATSALGVVTLTCLVKGEFGNFISLVSTGGTMTVGAALTGGTGGAQGAVTTYALGL